MSSSSCNGAQKKRRMSPSLSNKICDRLTLLELEKKKEAISKRISCITENLEQNPGMIGVVEAVLTGMD
eukprot:3828239-Prorocentrum_lima.AAC.1